MKSYGKFLSVLTAMLWISFDASAGQSSSPSPMGYWATAENKSKVYVYPCATDSHKVCGKIVALKEPIDPASGQEKKDPNGKPMMNMEIMKDFAHEEGSKWSGGTVYDPKEGKEYSGEFTLSADGNAMDLRGYVLISLIGRTQTWHRISEDAPLH